MGTCVSKEWEWGLIVFCSAHHGCCSSINVSKINIIPGVKQGFNVGWFVSGLCRAGMVNIIHAAARAVNFQASGRKIVMPSRPLSTIFLLVQRG
jgi:hypothetical protein